MKRGLPMDILDELIDFFEKNDDSALFQSRAKYSIQNIVEITERISKLSIAIKKDFPEYSARLLFLKDNLFMPSGYIHIRNFGRLAEALYFLKVLLERKEDNQWKYIHQEFYGDVKEKFLHGFYLDANFTATNILMQRLKNIHKQIDPRCPDIDGSDLIGKLFPNDAPKILFCEIDTKTGQNKQKGYADLFRGWVAAIRNKNAHPAMEKMTEIEAFQDIVLISMLMSALDNRKLPPRSSEQ